MVDGPREPSDPEEWDGGFALLLGDRTRLFSRAIGSTSAAAPAAADVLRKCATAGIPLFEVPVLAKWRRRRLRGMERVCGDFERQRARQSDE